MFAPRGALTTTHGSLYHITTGKLGQLSQHNILIYTNTVATGPDLCYNIPS